MAAGTIEVVFINNDGSGFADKVQVADHTTFGDFFKQRVGAGANPSNYTIRVTRVVGGVPTKYTPEAGARLQQGDRVSVLPNKVEGA